MAGARSSGGSGDRRNRPMWLAWAALVGVLAASGVAAFLRHEAVVDSEAAADVAAREHLDHTVAEGVAIIEAEQSRVAGFLGGLGGFIVSPEETTPARFQNYVDSARAADPELEHLAPFVADGRGTVTESLTETELQGQDLNEDPSVTEALDRARDDGLARMTARLNPAAGFDDAAGHTVVAPLYSAEAPETVTERRESIIGWVGVSIELDGAAGLVRPFAESVDEAALTLYDELGLAVAAPSSTNGQNAGESVVDGEISGDGEDSLVTVPVDLFGQDWVLQASAPPRAPTLDPAEPVLILLGGAGLSAVLFLLTWALGRSRHQALSLASHAVDSLNETKARLTERKTFEARLEHQATHDPLTAMPNRVLLADRLEGALARAKRSQSSIAVLFLDLDRFKLVNDTRGHDAGDELLTEAARRLRAVVRPADTVARFGGDEFVVLAEDLGDVTLAVDLAERIRSALEHPFSVGGDEAFISASIGIAYSADGRATAEGLISDADVAMYRAKEAGRARFEIFDGDMRAWVHGRHETEIALRHALDRNELELYYQPIVGIASNELRGFEALVRWNRPHVGVVGPDDFIPIAEDSGLILPIGDWAINEACQQAAHWADEGRQRRLGVSVNLSGRQLTDSDVADTVAKALAVSGADPAMLNFEITESVLFDDVSAVIENLNALKALGVRLALDDLGTGYSSLTYLRRFPLDVVKIDRSFVQNLDTEVEDSSIVRMIIALARTLHLEVVAEGVETIEQLEALRRLGCDYGQGYYFARPRPVQGRRKRRQRSSKLRDDRIDTLSAEVATPEPVSFSWNMVGRTEPT